ncbi:MAG: pilus assembly protein [Anaerolineales bacterium]|nr:pilus assembly protein [Anaerolineales bacterium]
MKSKEKGQSLVEFALILPLLLLLLLGIIEGARVIWGYVTVQQAAREAARYAVTGRPYLPDGAISTFEQTCLGNPTDITGYDYPGSPVYDPKNNEPNPVKVSAQPWLCSPTQRAQAIEQVAFSQANALNISERCSSYYKKHKTIDGHNYTECATIPSAFGVLVQGQVTTETVTGTLVIAPDPVNDNAGQEGLSVQVSTFYNLKMLTPIYDAIMGGNFIRLEGRAQLQNEGLDKTAGIEPPPGIGSPHPCFSLYTNYKYGWG